MLHFHANQYFNKILKITSPLHNQTYKNSPAVGNN
uniref:Uncharacterized protein n=1 Tax=Anguilla anguilla TaxID=7936 RepID=A0A0E9PU09_ANGAN